MYRSVPIKVVLDYFYIGDLFPAERGWWLIALSVMSCVVGMVRWRRKVKAGEWE